MTKSMVVKSPCNVENNVIITMDYPTSCNKYMLENMKGQTRMDNPEKPAAIWYI